MKKDQFIFLRNTPLVTKGVPTITFDKPADPQGYVTLHITVQVLAQVSTQDGTEISDDFLPGALFDFNCTLCQGLPSISFSAANEGSDTDTSILLQTDDPLNMLTSGIKVEHGDSVVKHNKYRDFGLD